MDFSLKYGENGIWYGQFSHFPTSFMTHAISTRFGGVSQDYFASLNLAMHNGDNINNVQENRHRFAKALVIAEDNVVTTQQVHSDTVLYVDKSFAGRGKYSYNEAIVATDALITDQPNLPLLLFFADCVPVLIVDPVCKVVGVSHAGWKGTVSKIAQKTIYKMQECCKTRPEDCLVGIGPSIGACCYEVGYEVAEQFRQSFPNYYSKLLEEKADKYKLDLWQANRLQLEEIGVKSQNIAVSGICTACNNDVFFSYRADGGKTGRIGAMISLIK